jgi:hypothetical protein
MSEREKAGIVCSLTATVGATAMFHVYGFSVFFLSQKFKIFF